MVEAATVVDTDGAVIDTTEFFGSPAADGDGADTAEAGDVAEGEEAADVTEAKDA